MGPVLVTGASGLLGPWILEAARAQGTEVLAWHGPGANDGRARLDLADAPARTAALSGTHCAGVLHLAAISSVAVCAAEPDRAIEVNVGVAVAMAAWARAQGLPFVFTSTDLVFDGTRAPYAEEDPPAPLSVYGRTKADAERQVRAAHPDATVVRLPLLFGPSRTTRRGFFDGVAAALRAGETVGLFEDERRTVLPFDTAAATLLALVRTAPTGIVHVPGPEALSRYEMGLHLARVLGAPAEKIVRGSRLAHAGEPRPADVSLRSTRHDVVTAGPEGSFEDACVRLFSVPR